MRRKSEHLKTLHARTPAPWEPRDTLVRLRSVKAVQNCSAAARALRVCCACAREHGEENTRQASKVAANTYVFSQMKSGQRQCSYGLGQERHAVVPHVAAAQLDDLQRGQPVSLARAYPDNRKIRKPRIQFLIVARDIDGVRDVIALLAGEPAASADHLKALAVEAARAGAVDGDPCTVSPAFAAAAAAT